MGLGGVSGGRKHADAQLEDLALSMCMIVGVCWDGLGWHLALTALEA